MSGISRKRSQALFNGSPISIPIELNFTSNESYKESLSKIIIELEKEIEKYESIIDNILLN